MNVVAIGVTLHLCHPRRSCCSFSSYCDFAFFSFKIKSSQKQYTDLTSGRSCVFLSFFKAYEQNMREKLHLNIEMFISKHENGRYDKIQ